MCVCVCVRADIYICVCVYYISSSFTRPLGFSCSRKPKNPEEVEMPDWVEDWWPEEPAPEPDYVGNEQLG